MMFNKRGNLSLAIPSLAILVGVAAAAPPRDRAVEETPKPASPAVEIVQVRKIWDRAPHNAFTDLVRFKKRWYCAFREGQGHVSKDGALRVLTSKDGESWSSVAVMKSDVADLRDAKLNVTPEGRLVLSGAGALHSRNPRHQTFAWTSADGESWSEAFEIGEPNLWLWRTSWRQKTAYGIGYSTEGRKFVRLYRSGDGRRFEKLVDDLEVEGYPNESSIVFLADGAALCLLRRDPLSALLGRAEKPYTEWTWKDLGKRIGGPHMIQLPDGRFLAVVRLYDGAARTALCSLDVDSGKLIELAKLPSGGDTSYAGLVWHDDLLWVSYYSSHEGKTSIYLAKVRVK